MSELDEIRKYLDVYLIENMSTLTDLDYSLTIREEENIPFKGRVAIYTFIQNKLNRRVDIEFIYTKTSPAGCIHTFIRRIPQEGKSEIYNGLQINVGIENYFAHEFSNPDSLKNKLEELNTLLQNDYIDSINGQKFNPDKVFRG